MAQNLNDAEAQRAKAQASTPALTKKTNMKSTSKMSGRTSSADATGAKPSTTSASVSDGLSQRETAMVADMARLEALLETATQRIQELESLNEQAVNRIDWVIDALQTVLDEQARR